MMDNITTAECIFDKLGKAYWKYFLQKIPEHQQWIVDNAKYDLLLNE